MNIFEQAEKEGYSLKEAMEINTDEKLQNKKVAIIWAEICTNIGIKISLLVEYKYPLTIPIIKAKIIVIIPVWQSANIIVESQIDHLLEK